MKMEPEGLKQSPQKPIAKKLDKVQETPIAPIDDSVNLLSTVWMFIRKKFENRAFSEFEISTGKIAAVTVGGGGGLGFLATVNLPLLLTGNPIEIVKVVVGVVGLLVAWFWKK